MKRRDFLRAVSGAALALALPKGSFGAETARKPNVVYVFSDTHRWCSLPFTETPGIHAPNMTTLKRQGVNFGNCFSNLPLCTPYRAIMQTGHWPFQSGYFENHLDLHYRVDGSKLTLGAMFKNAGYRTVYYGKWHLGPADGKTWGYDVFESEKGSKESGENTDRAMTAKAVSAIADHARTAGGAPLFLTLSIVDPHGPFAPTKENLERYASNKGFSYRQNDLVHDRKWYDNYYGEISGVDEMLGDVMRAIEQAGMAENTILIYTSDHGGMGGAQNVRGGQKRMPHDESSKVPFLIRWPGKIPTDKEMNALFSTIDIFPTLCGLANLSGHLKTAATPEAATCLAYIAECPGLDHSKNVLALPGGPDPESVFVMHPSNMTNNNDAVQTSRCIITKDYMYAIRTRFRPIASQGKGKAKKTGKTFGDMTPAGDWCLYDRKKDPLQMHNLIDDPACAAVKADLHAKLKAWIAKAETPFVENCFAKLTEEYLIAWNNEHGVAKGDRKGALAAYQEDFRGWD